MNKTLNFTPMKCMGVRLKHNFLEGVQERADPAVSSTRPI
jgi:hypothetical protein